MTVKLPDLNAKTFTPPASILKAAKSATYEYNKAHDSLPLAGHCAQPHPFSKQKVGTSELGLCHPLPIQPLSCCHLHPQLQCTYPKWCFLRNFWDGAQHVYSIV